MYIQKFFNPPNARINNGIMITRSNFETETKPGTMLSNNIGFKGNISPEIYKQILTDNKLLASLGIIASSLLYNNVGRSDSENADYATEILGHLVKKSETKNNNVENQQKEDEAKKLPEENVEDKSKMINIYVEDANNNDIDLQFKKMEQQFISEDPTKCNISIYEYIKIANNKENTDKKETTEPVKTNKFGFINNKNNDETNNKINNSRKIDSNFTVKRAGTMSNEVHKSIDSLFLIMKKELKDMVNTRINTLILFPVYRVSENDVISQLDKYKDFKNITKENVDMITNVLNSGKFTGMFSLHGAMRLIERYVDFNSNISIENQIDELIRILKLGINDSIHYGTTFNINISEKIKNNNKNEIYNPNLIIEPNKLSENIKDDFINKFGTFPLYIALARKKNANFEYVVSTLFTRGC